MTKLRYKVTVLNSIIATGKRRGMPFLLYLTIRKEKIPCVLYMS